MELHLKITGYILIIFSLIHFIFPKYFDWKNDLGKMSMINRQMMYVHTFFIALTLLLMGILCLTSPKELLETAFGGKIALGFCIFWFIRLLIQLFGYSTKLWKGKSFETFIHILFSFCWIYLSTVFFLIYWENKGI
jgi:hypothetical protein